MWIINRQAYTSLYTYVNQNDRNNNTEKMIQCLCICASGKFSIQAELNLKYNFAFENIRHDFA